MAEDKPISKFAQRFVARTLERLTKEANNGAGLYYELFAQNFTDSVDRLAARTKRPDLREHILAEAGKTGNYMAEEKQHGRWDYDMEAGDLRWNGKPLDWMKQVDGYGQWVRKSEDERARYVLGHYGEGSQPGNEYPGIQVEKDGVIGPVKWGPEQRTGQRAHEVAEKMLDTHLGFAAPRLEPPSYEDMRKSDQMSERLGVKVYTKAYRKYIKQSAAVGNSAAKKYGASESAERDTPPPRKSR